MAPRRITRAREILPPGAPRLGFGCGDLYGGAHSAGSRALLQAALDAGIRWFDVARLYGDGAAEAVLGQVLPCMRDEIVLVSKAGIVPWSMQTGARVTRKAQVLARRLAGPLGPRLIPEPQSARERYGVFDPAALRRSVERSLRDLRTDRLDLLLLHECSLAHARAPETQRLLERLRTEGKVLRFGVATGASETIRILQAIPEAIEVAQFPSDAADPAIARVPQAWSGLVVTHSPVRRMLAGLEARLAAEPALAQRWREDAGVDPGDRSALVALLIADALDRNPEGAVLFSTSRPERVAPTLKASLATDGRAIRLLRQTLEAASCPALPGPPSDAVQAVA